MRRKLAMAGVGLVGMLAGVLFTLTFLNGSRAQAQVDFSPPGGSPFLQVPPLQTVPTVRNIQANRIPTMNNVWRILWQAETADGRAMIYWEDGRELQIFPRIR